MDRLEEIFSLQKQFNDEVIANRKLEGDNELWMQRYMMAMFVEMAELLDETNYKWWKNPKVVDEDAVKEELVDVLHFFISLCIRSGMDAQDLYSRYLDKNKENILRQQGKGKKDGYSLKEIETPKM